MGALKFLPHLLAFGGLVLALLRGFPLRRRLMASVGCSGFILGQAGALLFLQRYPGDFSFGMIRTVIGACFFALWGVSVAALYRSSGRNLPLPRWDAAVATPLAAATVALGSGALAGAICAARIVGSEAAFRDFALCALAAALLAALALPAEKRISPSLTVTPAGAMTALAALLLLSCSYLLRLDLFAPLSMKVMKFTHDFVHQSFESMLIPDHLFIRSYLWGYIGLLFGKEVGFWGGLLIWFAPVVLVLTAIGMERLPAVAHIRQGAQRRKLLAAAIHARRLKMVIPVLSFLLLGAAVYQSRNPSVEYWDPKPVPVSASPSGEIFLPRKGEIDLMDGKLHKYLYKQGGKEVRFFVLLTPNGQLSVDLDACAICKPDGYGQAEGTVICYYCKTLIPLETVGKPGGCNPVPVPFVDKPDGVHIDGITLLSNWNSTVQATSGTKGGPK
jgi:hypothetical protein